MSSKKYTSIAIGLVVMAITMLVTNSQKAKPLEEQILAAEQVTVLGESAIPDGGSCVFHMQLNPGPLMTV